MFLGGQGLGTWGSIPTTSQKYVNFLASVEMESTPIISSLFFKFKLSEDKDNSSSIKGKLETIETNLMGFNNEPTTKTNKIESNKLYRNESYSCEWKKKMGKRIAK